MFGAGISVLTRGCTDWPQRNAVYRAPSVHSTRPTLRSLNCIAGHHAAYSLGGTASVHQNKMIYGFGTLAAAHSQSLRHPPPQRRSRCACCAGAGTAAPHPTPQQPTPPHSVASASEAPAPAVRAPDPDLPSHLWMVLE